MALLELAFSSGARRKSVEIVSRVLHRFRLGVITGLSCCGAGSKERSVAVLLGCWAVSMCGVIVAVQPIFSAGASARAKIVFQS